MYGPHKVRVVRVKVRVALVNRAVRVQRNARVVRVVLEILVRYDKSESIIMFDCTADNTRFRRTQTVQAGSVSGCIVGNIAVGNCYVRIGKVYPTAVFIRIIFYKYAARNCSRAIQTQIQRTAIVCRVVCELTAGNGNYIVGIKIDSAAVFADGIAGERAVLNI